MINRKLGIVLLGIAVVFSVLLVLLTNSFFDRAEQLGCYPDTEACIAVDSSLAVTHVGFGVIGFVLALGVYLLFFYSGEQAIIRRLEDEKSSSLKDARLDLIMRAMDDSEKSVFRAVVEQDGISQSTLVLRSGLSKSKVSEILSDFEAKKLVKKVKKGKINFIYCLEC